MAARTANRDGKGKKGRKIGRNTIKCAAYRAAHHITRNHRFTQSREHRNCGPLARHNRTSPKESEAVRWAEKSQLPLFLARQALGLPSPLAKAAEKAMNARYS